MSDSDDTDILLLIPPNFFFNESNLSTSLDYNLFESNLQEKTLTTSLCRSQQFQSSKMDSSNCHHSSFEYRKFPNHSSSAHFTSPSATRLTDFPSSTPIDVYKSMLGNEKKADEVEKYFSNISLRNKHSHSDPVSVIGSNRKISPSAAILRTPVDPFQNPGYIQEDDILKSLTSNRMSDWNAGIQKSADKNDKLIDMGTIWRHDGKRPHPSIDKTFQNKDQQVQIEQLNNAIDSLRLQLKQSEAKYIEAFKMEQSKNDALKHLHAANVSLMTNLSQLESQLSSIELKSREENDMLRLENEQLRANIKNIQANNDILEQKNFSILKSTNEVREVSEKQLDDLKIRLSNAQHTENALRNEISGLKLQIAAVKNENDSDKYRTNSLQKKILDLQKLIDEYRDRELNFKKDIEEQRNYLKNYYQNQLDAVVNKKRNEYQHQLDGIEESIRRDAKKTEKNIAERAIKQIELINQKHEQELALVDEKHQKEIELYRIQLGSATKLIGQLEKNLYAYKEKRNDIAERLQSVMQTQWKKTMEIIGNNDTTVSSLDPKTKQFLEELSQVVADEHDNKPNARLSSEEKRNSIKSSKPKLLSNIEFD